MTDSEIRALIEQEVTAQLQAMNTKDIASETDIPTLSDAEWDTNNALTSMPVVYNGSTWRKIGLSFLRTLRNAAAVINTAWNSLTNNGTNVSWIPTVNPSGVAGKSSPADLASVLGATTVDVPANTTLSSLGIGLFSANPSTRINELPLDFSGYHVLVVRLRNGVNNGICTIAIDIEANKGIYTCRYDGASWNKQ